MSLSLWIPADLQFGQPELGANPRPSAMRQAVAQAIKRHLFEESGCQTAGVAYNRILLAFTKKNYEDNWFVAPTARPVAKALWAFLFPADDLTAGYTVKTDTSQVPKSFEAVFCFVVHGLCSELALRWMKPSDGTTEAELTDDQENDENIDDATPVSMDLHAEYTHVLDAVTNLLRQSVWRWLRDNSSDKQSKSEDLRLIAAVLLDTLLAVLNDWFTVETSQTTSHEGRPHTPKYIVLRQEALAQRIETLAAELPFRFTVQPLNSPVAYQTDDHGPDNNDERDYFHVDLIGYRRSNDFLYRLHTGMLENKNCDPKFKLYVQAVNIQQAVPWRINRQLLNWARCLGAIASVHSIVNTEDPALDNESRQSLCAWVKENFYQPAPVGGRKTIKRSGEFVDSPLARHALDELCPPSVIDASTTFYLPWKADYRGRIYAETPWFTPQGGDLQRALLEFANGRPLDEHGICALRRHGANLVRRSRLLSDLGITDRQVITLAERECWVSKHEEQIIASAVSPLTEPFWREVAGKPMQFLAFCLAYRQWHMDHTALIHLPVQIDGTCNGMQHIAALTGDEALARGVNVLSRDDGLLGDIYSELASAAADTIGQLSSTKTNAVHRQGLELADAWLAAGQERRAWLNRDTAKKVVMTIPYGASEGAQARYVLETIADEFEKQWEKEAPQIEDLSNLLIWKSGKKARRYLVYKCTRSLFEAQRRQVFLEQDEEKRASPQEDLERKRTLAAYVALAIVKHLRAALSIHYPSVDRFSHWLKQTAKACAGLPLLWLTPLGLPVCQDKFRLKGSSVTVHANYGTKTVRIDVQRLDDTVDPGKQRDALLPNLIHSLDATHLAMTLLDANRHNVTDIGSIHDCLLCHPNDAATLGRSVRKTFVLLYRANSAGVSEPLACWRDWMDLLARLRTLHHAAAVLGALDNPAAAGELVLCALATRDQDAQRALEVLAAVRALDPPRRFLARMLLDYLSNHSPPAVTGQDAQKSNWQPELSLKLSESTQLSEYFFS